MKHPLSRKLLALCTTVALSFSLALSPLASWAEQPQKALENTQLTEQLPSLESPAEQPSLELETETNNTPQSDTALPTPKGNSDDAAPATNALAEQAAEEVSAKKPLVILHTNDVHCGASQAVDKQGNPTTVGYAGVSTILKEAETTYGKEHVTLVDAGDAIQGKPMGTLSEGSYLIDIMKQVGYDLAIPGNHEFDYGMDRFMELVERAKTPQTGMSSFNYVSANFNDLRTNKPVFDPYQIITYPDGTKVAYVGISTPESLTKSSPSSFKDKNGNYLYGFCEDTTGAALYERVQQTVDNARTEGAHYVVAIGHLGESGVTPQWRADTVIQNTSGIDVFIDGHSHEQYTQNISPKPQKVRNSAGKLIPLAQTGTQLQTVGKIVIDPANTSTPLTCELIPPPIAQDKDTLTYVTNIENELNKTLGKKIANTEVKLVAVEDDERKNWAVRMRETNLGNLCADSLRAALETDIAFSNGGGIRSDVAAGDITYGDAISVMPFGNSLCKIETTGQAILDALEMGARLYPQPSGGFLQPSGLTYELRSDIPTSVQLDERGNFIGVDEPRRVQNVRVAEQAIDPIKTYTLASITYLLKEGGDGFTMFKDSKIIVDEQGLEYEALIAFLQNNLKGTIGSDSIYANEKGEGRILVKNGPDPAPIPSPDPAPADPVDPAANPLATTGDSLVPVSTVASTLAFCALVALVGAARALQQRHQRYEQVTKR